METKTYSEKKFQEARSRDPNSGAPAEEFADDYSSVPEKLPPQKQQTVSTSPGENTSNAQDSLNFIIPEI